MPGFEVSKTCEMKMIVKTSNTPVVLILQLNMQQHNSVYVVIAMIAWLIWKNYKLVCKMTSVVRRRRTVTGWTTSCFLSSTHTREGQQKSHKAFRIRQILLSRPHFSKIWMARERQPTLSFNSSSKSSLKNKDFSSWCIRWLRFAG